MADHAPSLSDGCFDAERRRLQRMARALLYDAESAEDAVQEAWLLLLRRADGTPGDARAWLAGSVRKLASSMRREAARRVRRERAAARAERVPAAAEVAGRIEVLRRVLDAVEALEEPYRRTIVARFLDGLAPRVIARREGIAVATVRTRVRRGLQRLRRALDGEDEETRRSFLAALAPLAASPPWEFAPIGELVRNVPELAGGLAMKLKVKLGLCAFVGLLIAGGVAWRVIGRALPLDPVRAVEPSSSSDEYAPSTASAERHEDTPASTPVVEPARVGAAPVRDWEVRGCVTLARRRALADARLILRLYEGPSSAGAVLAQGSARSDEHGAFAWAAPRPEGLTTLSIALADDDATLSFERILFPDEAAPSDLVLVAYPLDVVLLGRVLDTEGAPVAIAFVARIGYTTRTDYAGRFRLRVSSETPRHHCRVIAQGFGIARFTLTSRGAGERPIEDIVLQRALPLRGRVIDESGQPVADGDLLPVPG